jgi:hypothetical protein
MPPLSVSIQQSELICKIQETGTEALWGLVPAALTPSLITVTFVVMGWWVVGVQHSKRERRKHIQEACSELIASINEIMQEAIKYHTNTSLDTNIENQLKINLGRLFRNFDRLAHYEKPVFGVFNTLPCSLSVPDKLLETFQKSIDSSHFGAEEWEQPLLQGDAIIQQIYSAAESLEHSLSIIKIELDH